MAVIWGVEIFGPLIERHGQGGHIVNTASIAGLISGGGNPYNVTKYGVVALSEGLRVELAPRGIGVSVLCPGFVQTRIGESHRNMPAHVRASLPEETGPGLNEAVASGIPAVEVADAVFDAVVADRLYVLNHPEMARGALDQRLVLLFDQGG